MTPEPTLLEVQGAVHALMVGWLKLHLRRLQDEGWERDEAEPVARLAAHNLADTATTIAVRSLLWEPWP